MDEWVRFIRVLELLNDCEWTSNLRYWKKINTFICLIPQNTIYHDELTHKHQELFGPRQT